MYCFNSSRTFDLMSRQYCSKSFRSAAVSATTRSVLFMEASFCSNSLKSVEGIAVLKVSITRVVRLTFFFAFLASSFGAASVLSASSFLASSVALASCFPSVFSSSFFCSSFLFSSTCISTGVSSSGRVSISCALETSTVLLMFIFTHTFTLDFSPVIVDGKPLTMYRPTRGGTPELASVYRACSWKLPLKSVKEIAFVLGTGLFFEKTEALSDGSAPTSPHEISIGCGVISST
mmetsp:Transcript_28230/g.68673  ORF Transcript_28230/g.68673 Transcript_28230/m.68673 type:complete len:234 (+) Transcript_28230:744-1445(+)